MALITSTAQNIPIKVGVFEIFKPDIMIECEETEGNRNGAKKENEAEIEELGRNLNELELSCPGVGLVGLTAISEGLLMSKEILDELINKAVEGIEMFSLKQMSGELRWLQNKDKAIQLRSRPRLWNRWTS